ncbi:MAG: DUF302 domain-containing protein [Bacteroidetes bacterium]|nr:DUF302 domain-containing protein [Bacteroidota bacterium]MBU1114164.1 DUF302 domain-containing protein [Bacteroidota bacterium]MBU1800120.1 DUF302 domain-containing protein [Bacteroidota bacterium]
MSYYISKTINATMDEAFEKVSDALQLVGFGIVTDFNVSNAFKNKLEIDFRPYRILGVCNPPYAKKALDADNKIGVMLPCNMVLQLMDKGVEVTVIDTVASMAAVDDPIIKEIAQEIKVKLNSVLDSL